MKLAVSPSKLAPLLHILVPILHHIVILLWVIVNLLNYHYKNEASLDIVPRRRVHLLDINVSLADKSFSFSSAVWKLKCRLRDNVAGLYKWMHTSFSCTNIIQRTHAHIDIHAERGHGRKKVVKISGYSLVLGARWICQAVIEKILC